MFESCRRDVAEEHPQDEHGRLQKLQVARGNRHPCKHYRTVAQHLRGVQQSEGGGPAGGYDDHRQQRLPELFEPGAHLYPHGCAEHRGGSFPGLQQSQGVHIPQQRFESQQQRTGELLVARGGTPAQLGQRNRQRSLPCLYVARQPLPAQLYREDWLRSLPRLQQYAPPDTPQRSCQYCQRPVPRLHQSGNDHIPQRTEGDWQLGLRRMHEPGKDHATVVAEGDRKLGLRQVQQPDECDRIGWHPTENQQQLIRQDYLPRGRRAYSERLA